MAGKDFDWENLLLRFGPNGFIVSRLCFLIQVLICFNFTNHVTSSIPGPNLDSDLGDPRTEAVQGIKESYETEIPAPWDRESPMTRELFTNRSPNGKARFHLVDPWHTIHLGIGKSWVACGIIMIQALLPESCTALVTVPQSTKPFVGNTIGCHCSQDWPVYFWWYLWPHWHLEQSGGHFKLHDVLRTLLRRALWDDSTRSTFARVCFLCKYGSFLILWVC